MAVEVRRVLTVDVPEDQDFGAAWFDDGPGYEVVRVERKPGWRGKLPGRLGERVLTRTGDQGLSLALAKQLAREQADEHGGKWVVRESEHKG